MCLFGINSPETGSWEIIFHVVAKIPIKPASCDATTGGLTKTKTQEQSTLSLVSETDAEVAQFMNPATPTPTSQAVSHQDDDIAYSPEAQVPEEELDAGATTDEAETPRIAIRQADVEQERAVETAETQQRHQLPVTVRNLATSQSY